jgi:hypothetical protein
MSLFDLVIGNSGWPPMLMGISGLEPEMVARYRDHWIEREDEDTLILAVYVRLGGGNRPDYTEQLDAMHALPSFVSDEDDRFDSTYCTLRFRLPKAVVTEWFEENRRDDAPNTTEELWEELWRASEPIPRDMSIIWEAIIGTLGAHNDE